MCVVLTFLLRLGDSEGEVSASLVTALLVLPRALRVRLGAREGEGESITPQNYVYCDTIGSNYNAC